jgi:hypothetical protein
MNETLSFTIPWKCHNHILSFSLTIARGWAKTWVWGILLTVDVTQIYTFKTPSTASVWKEHNHKINIFYPIISSTCTWSIWCRHIGNGDKWVSGTHLVGSLDPLWGSLASQSGHDPWEKLQSHSWPLDEVCVFSQWLIFSSHGSMGPQRKQINQPMAKPSSTTYDRWAMLLEEGGRPHLP